MSRPHVSLCCLCLLIGVVSRGTGEGPVASTAAASEPPEDYSKYYNYVEMTGLLQSLARTYPHIANLSSVGRSVLGRELWVMRITAEPPTDAPVAGRPGFKYVGNMHGDETVSRQVLVYLVEYLLARYGEDPRVTELVNTTDIYIMPSMNPDGFEMSTEGHCNGDAVGRQNARKVDLNRSFPDQYKETRVDKEVVPEVWAVMQWILEKK